MRLDKFLKVTRIIKSSYDVKKGDIFEIKYFNKNIKVKVLDLPPESLKKEFIDEYIQIID